MKTWKLIVLMLCCSMIGVCGKYLYDYFAQSAENKNAYADITVIGFPDDADNQDVDISDDETEKEMEVSDFDYDSLLTINSDCIGWIRIDGTDIDILDRVGNREDERIFQWLKRFTKKIREDDWREFEKALNLYLKGKDTSVFETEELFAIYDSIMLMSIKWREQFKVFSTEHPKSAKIKSKGKWSKKYYALCFNKKKEQHSQVVTEEMCYEAFAELM